VLHLGHGGDLCSFPGKRETFTIMHSNGFHKLAVVFCGCAMDVESLSPQIQLLRSRLFPATTDKPKTAFTFSSLDLLAQLSTQGKLSAYNFYIAMRSLTDPLDIAGWPVSDRISKQKNEADSLP
jgi:hypothetical protein